MKYLQPLLHQNQLLQICRALKPKASLRCHYLPHFPETMYIQPPQLQLQIEEKTFDEYQQILRLIIYQSDVGETTRIQKYLPSSMHPLYILRISSTANESSISSLSITATIEIRLSYDQKTFAHFNLIK